MSAGDIPKGMHLCVCGLYANIVIMSVQCTYVA